ncbi:MAG: cysteine synthase, partial [Fidelibacterota bacterium]
MSNISSDLTLFNELAEFLINEEEKFPVAPRIEPNKLSDLIDLSLNATAMVDDDFMIILKKVLVLTPKTATKLFFNQLFGGRQGKAVLG